MMNFTENNRVSNIKQFIKSMNFSKYIADITELPPPKLLRKFSDWFESPVIGTPLMSLDSSYQFLLTTEYLFWKDDCEGFGYLPIDDLIFIGDEKFDGVFAVNKEDSYGGFIVDDDVEGPKKMHFIKDLNQLIEFITSLQ